MNILDKFQMKLVRITEVIVTIIGTVSLALGLWLYFISNDSHLAVWFPIFFGAISLYNTYKLHRTITLNNKKISSFQIKYHFFMYVRGVFVCLTYLGVVVHNIPQAIGFAVCTLCIIGIEILIRRMEAKRLKNRE